MSWHARHPSVTQLSTNLFNNNSWWSLKIADLLLFTQHAISFNTTHLKTPAEINISVILSFSIKHYLIQWCHKQCHYDDSKYWILERRITYSKSNPPCLGFGPEHGWLIVAWKYLKKRQQTGQTQHGKQKDDKKETYTYFFNRDLKGKKGALPLYGLERTILEKRAFQYMIVD